MFGHHHKCLGTGQRPVLLRDTHRLERLPQIEQQVDDDAGLRAGLLLAQVLEPQRRLDGRLLRVHRADGAQYLQPAPAQEAESAQVMDMLNQRPQHTQRSPQWTCVHDVSLATSGGATNMLKI